MSDKELWKRAEEYYRQAMQTDDDEVSIGLYDKCIQTLVKASENETDERKQPLLLLNIQQAEANKRTVKANMLMDRSQNEDTDEQAAMHLREAANCHLESVKFREEAASIARDLGDIASCYNLKGSASQDMAFYHSYLALEAQKNHDHKKALEEYRKALEFMEAALEHFDQSLSINFNEETETNRWLCQRYIENFRADVRAAERI